MQTQQQTQFQPSYYGWMEAEIIHAEGKTSRAGHAMTHVKVRTEADDIYDGYLTSSGYPPARAAVLSLKRALAIADDMPLPAVTDMLGKKVSVMVMPWVKEGRSRDVVTLFAPSKNQNPTEIEVPF